jgi:hypothetical protein
MKRSFAIIALTFLISLEATAATSLFRFSPTTLSAGAGPSNPANGAVTINGNSLSAGDTIVFDGIVANESGTTGDNWGSINLNGGNFSANQSAGVWDFFEISAAHSGLGRFNSSSVVVSWVGKRSGMIQLQWVGVVVRLGLNGGKTVSIHSQRTAFVRPESGRVCANVDWFQHSLIIVASLTL